MEQKKKIRFPHVFIILFSMMVLFLLLSYVIPSGAYERVLNEATGREIVDPSTFKYVTKNYMNPLILLTAIPQGMVDSASIIFTVIIIGGAWEIINRSGAIACFVKTIALKLKGKEMWLFPILMIIFMAIMAIVGALELSIVFVPAIMPIMLAMGYDTITAAATVLVAGGSAFSAAITNPYTVGIADQITGLPMYSGMWYRLIILGVFYVISVVYVLIYAKKVKAYPEKSLCYEETVEMKKEMAINDSENDKMTIGHVITLLSFLAGIVLIVIGFLKFGWYMTQLSAVFMGIAFIAAMTSKMKANDFCEYFTEGAKSVTLAALVIGLSRGILVIIESASIIDTIIMVISKVVNVFPDPIKAAGIFLVQSLFNFLVPSGSGQTLITMPILSPMADIVGITKQSVVLATQLGDGITNILYPVSGVLMAVLSQAKISWNKWAKFVWPVVVIFTVLGVVFLMIAQAISYGPF